MTYPEMVLRSMRTPHVASEVAVLPLRVCWHTIVHGTLHTGSNSLSVPMCRCAGEGRRGGAIPQGAFQLRV